MSTSLTEKSVSRHPVLPDIGRPVMAKADVREPDMDWLVVIGRAIQRAVAIVGWSNKEAAAKAGVDDAEFGKWGNGSRHPHLDRRIALEAWRGPLIFCLAKELDDSGIVPTWGIEIRQKKKVG